MMVESEGIPASYFQADLWRSTTRRRVSGYNVLSVWMVHGARDAAVVVEALEVLTARHDILRTHFGGTNGAVQQMVTPRVAVDVWTADVSGCRAPAEELRLMAMTDVGRPFDLRRGPLWRAGVVTLAPAVKAVVLTAHHCVADAWTLGLLRSEFRSVLRARVAGGSDPLGPPPVQFGQVAAWERGPHGNAEAQWRAHLSPLPERPRLPFSASWWNGAFDLASSPFAGTTRTTVEGIERLAAEHETGSASVVYAAAVATVASYVPGGEIVIGVAYSGRHRDEWVSVAGPLFDYLPLRLCVSEELPFASLVAEVAVELKQARRRCMPLGRIVEVVETRWPLFDLLVNVLPTSQPAPPLAGAAVDVVQHPVAVDWLRVPVERSFYGAGLLGYVVRGTDLGGLTYTNDSALPGPLRETFGQALQRVLSRAAEGAERPIKDLVEE
jgi:hypothetical protein